MRTTRQKLRGCREKGKPTRWKSKLLGPHRKRVCVKLWTRSPKKPNSAQRKGATVRVFYPRKKNLPVFLPGEGKHGLRAYSVILLRGGRRRDLPGVKYQRIRGVRDLVRTERLGS